MNNVTQIVQKVRQAPWREQRQWIGLFLLGLVLVAMVAAIYLNVTVRTAIAGREIQMLQAQIADNQRINADLETQLAALTSVAAVQQRAEVLGFQPAKPDDVTYVIVPGYAPRKVVDMSVHDESDQDAPVLLPDYTESLFDWFTRKLAASVPSGVQP
jgi:cell division protein FtsL